MYIALVDTYFNHKAQIVHDTVLASTNNIKPNPPGGQVDPGGTGLFALNIA